ncbi:MAG: MFS transporter [Calditrichaceae bacterium]|nr:MFS transporter [Calditrichaceae bacterium]MBN2708306.1 MFS transporter [Calditrichaceae bacterium]RQV97239.1 MAG: MFS transporter [Calditrichota bacterium]
MTNNSFEKKDAPAVYRWIVLVFISLAMFGNYYIYDSIAPIADMLKSSLNFTDENLGQMYSVYSIAAIIVLLIGGVIIDKYGTKISILVFSIISTIAAIVTWSSSDLSIMLTGRVLLGLGSEPLIVAITTALAKWFKGKELSFAFGLNLTIARLGSVAADNSPSWAGSFYSNWQDPLFLAILISLSCVIGGIVYWILEKTAESKYKLAQAGETDKFDFKNLFGYSKSFWFIVALCVTFYSAIFPFRSFAIKFFIEAHNSSREFAGFLNSILPMSAMIATPLFGLLADRIGKRSMLMAFGSVLILPVYLMMVYFDISLYIPIIMMGTAFSLIPAVMWPSVAYIVKEKKLGTAYSIMTLIQQVGVALFNWMIGKANDMAEAGVDNPEGYIPGMWIFSVLGLIGLLFAFLLWKVETGPKGHGLELGIKERNIK